MRYYNEYDHGSGLEDGDPRGFDRCAECSMNADGIYVDDGYAETFICYACCQKEAARHYSDRYEPAPVPDDLDLPF